MKLQYHMKFWGITFTSMYIFFLKAPYSEKLILQAVSCHILMIVLMSYINLLNLSCLFLSNMEPLKEVHAEV